MPSSSDQAPKHVPAWRKLGLKLKNAGEEQEAVGGLNNGISPEKPNTLKRKLPPETESSEIRPTENGLSKKKKKRSSALPENKSTASIALSTDCQKANPQVPVTPPLQRKKSVTFAPDTKAEDGDSIKQYYKKWLRSQRRSDPDFDASRLGPALKAIVPAPARIIPEQSAIALADTSLTVRETPTEPAKKKQKKSKSTSKSSLSLQTPSLPSKESSSPYIHPALDYLTTHHTSPNAWKFNKAHQNYILKHLFRLNTIPSRYDPALASYLKGLASENTKARIRREAIEIRIEDEKWLATPEPEHDSSENNGKHENTNGTEMGVERETPEQHLARRLRDYNAAVDKVRSILEAKEDNREATEWDLGPAREEWEARLLQRQRAEVVLWGVGENGEKLMEELQTATKRRQEQEQHEEHQAPPKPMRKLAEQPSFRTQMGPKRIKFGQDDEANGLESPDASNASKITTESHSNETNGAQAPLPTIPPSSSATTTNRKKKRARKAKYRQGAIPDDLTSSDSAHSDLSDDEETKRVLQRKKDLQEQLAAQERELERARREVEEELSDDEEETSSDSGSGSSSSAGDESEGESEGTSESEGSK